MKKLFLVLLTLTVLVSVNSFACDIDMQLKYPFSNKNSLNLNKFIGKKPVLVVFFYPECTPCEKSSKTINALYRRYKNNINIIGISLSKDRYDLEDFVSDLHVRYPVYRIEDKDQLKCVGGIFATPTTIIIDKNGKVAEKMVGPRNYSFMMKKIEQYIKK